MTCTARIVLLSVGFWAVVCGGPVRGQAQPPRNAEKTFSEVETRLRPLAEVLKDSEWNRRHWEPGQTFEEYQKAWPVRRSRQNHTIYLALIGDFTGEQVRVLNATKEYLEVFFDSPVKVRRAIPLEEIPAKARRTHPKWGDRQILSQYVLYDVLKPDRPDDALAYVAFTASDLWPGAGWNFVFGEASLRDRTGVWSIYRNGDPSRGKEAYRQCLRRTLGTASHETGHILTMYHCTQYACSMNGSNSLEEADRKPLHLCPVCLRKLCWNLQVEPVPYLMRLEAFYRKYGLNDEAEWCAKAIRAFTLDKVEGRP